MLPELAPPLSQPIELSDTPFYPQQDYQCGPAALATVLDASGVGVSPDDLVGQVYVPAKKGSLQVEMLAATRRAGRIPYVIEPSLSALRAEIDAGHPVLVMQNLGLGFWPVWHYAVVVGLNPIDDTVVLRSGTQRRELMSAHKFLRSWRLAERWGVVALRPGSLPAQPALDRMLSATAVAEPLLTPRARQAAYRVMLERWPSNPTARFGYAHALYASGGFTEAEREYRLIIEQQPRHAAALNNLAEVQAALGCHTQAIATAQRALAIAETDQPALLGPIQATLDELQAKKPVRTRCRSSGTRIGTP